MLLRFLRVGACVVRWVQFEVEADFSNPSNFEGMGGF